MMDIDVVGSGHNGKDAIEWYIEKSQDIVFLDLMMPEYDGIYAMRKIRKANPKAKIVMITADLGKDAGQKLEGLRPDRIIFKPFNYDKIISA